VLTALALGVALNSAAAVILWHSQDVQVRSNTGTTVAVCALRADLKRRVTAGVKFLQTHPNGVLGVKARDIRESIDAQQRTIAALSALDCTKP
jgi:hypothetical protein